VASEGVGVGVGDVDGVVVGVVVGLVRVVGDVDGAGEAVGVADGLVGVGVARLVVFSVVVDVAFALAAKRLSITVFSVLMSSGWAIETTIFPAGSMTYTVGMPFVLYVFLRLSPPVKIGHVVPIELTYVELIAFAEAPVVSTLRN
jgi:hypothetical protein